METIFDCAIEMKGRKKKQPSEQAVGGHLGNKKFRDLELRNKSRRI